MTEQHVQTVRVAPSGWLPPDVEARAYEAIRHGDEVGFRTVAVPLQPVLRRLAGLSQPDPDEVDALVAHSWRVVLRALDRFCWHTPFATWVARITIAHCRAHAVTDHSDLPVVVAGPRAAPGPPDWSDLPWGARWEGVLPVLGASLQALPLPQREVVHAHDVERWPRRRVCDVLALPEEAEARLLTAGRRTMRDVLARWVGDTDHVHLTAQADRTAAILPQLVWSEDRDAPQQLDARTLRAFRGWRRARTTGWRRTLQHRERRRRLLPQAQLTQV